jgi:hypothetical protein
LPFKARRLVNSAGQTPASVICRPHAFLGDITLAGKSQSNFIEGNPVYARFPP